MIFTWSILRLVRSEMILRWFQRITDDATGQGGCGLKEIFDIHGNVSAFNIFVICKQNEGFLHRKSEHSLGYEVRSTFTFC